MLFDHVTLLAWFFERNRVLVLVTIVVVVFLATSGRRSRRRCPNCHEVNPDHANYCAQCGNRLDPE